MRDNYPDVYAFCLRKLNNHADAEDVTQSVFMAYAALTHEPPEPTFWLIRAADNLCRNAIRKRKLMLPLQDVADTEDTGLVEHLRESLTEAEFDALSKVVSGYTLNEAAAAQGVTYEQMRHLLRRAKRQAIVALAVIGITSACIWYSMKGRSVAELWRPALHFRATVPDYRADAIRVRVPMSDIAKSAEGVVVRVTSPLGEIADHLFRVELIDDETSKIIGASDSPPLISVHDGMLVESMHMKTQPISGSFSVMLITHRGPTPAGPHDIEVEYRLPNANEKP